MKHRFGNVTDFNPYFGTDYGICSIIKPQLAFNRCVASILSPKKTVPTRKSDGTKIIGGKTIKYVTKS